MNARENEHRVDPLFGAPEGGTDVVQVDVLGAAPAVEEQSKVRPAFDDVLRNGQPGRQHLQERKMQKLDELGAFSGLTHVPRLGVYVS